jgi:hypothetical protein
MSDTKGEFKESTDDVASKAKQSSIKPRMPSPAGEKVKVAARTVGEKSMRLGSTSKTKTI